MPKTKPFTAEEIEAALTALPNWKVVTRTPSGADHEHTELHRLFAFPSFLDAMHFMLTAARLIQLSDHHPSWQNTYSKLEVWITTGDLKHRLSAKDFTLARYLEDLFQQYQSPNS